MRPVGAHDHGGPDGELAGAVQDDSCRSGIGCDGEGDAVLECVGSLSVVLCEVLAVVASEADTEDFRAGVDLDCGDAIGPPDRVQRVYEV